MESSVNTKTGLITIPLDGFYEITFTGALKTFGAKRIWVTIMKKSKDGGDFKQVKTYFFDDLHLG
jgi:hypothetical protein